MIQHIYQEPQFGEDWFTYPEFYKLIVEKFPSGSHFVEIGCWKGKSSAFMAVEIANSGKKIKFDCIDTWLGSEEHLDDDFIKNNTLYELFLNNMKPLNAFFTPIKMLSIEASKMYKDNSLDFVFIDGDHSYDGVLSDIKHWEPKVKVGGIISGHDYNSWESVTKAVDEYYKNDVIPFEGKTDCHCWYVIK